MPGITTLTRMPRRAHSDASVRAIPIRPAFEAPYATCPGSPVSAATEEMSAQASEVNQAIAGIAAVAEENSAATQQVAASAEQMAGDVQGMRTQAVSLAQTADTLRSLVAQFTLDQQTESPDADEEPFAEAA